MPKGSVEKNSRWPDNTPDFIISIVNRHTGEVIGNAVLLKDPYNLNYAGTRRMIVDELLAGSEFER